MFSSSSQIMLLLTLTLATVTTICVEGRCGDELADQSQVPLATTDCNCNDNGDKIGVACRRVDAFRRLPLVTTIERAQDLSEFCRDEGSCDCSKPYSYDYRFDAAANFPLPAYGLRGAESDREGAIIYEGMRFAIRKDGRYQVRFVVETPAMPVTMRLQLILEDEATLNRYTLTLPPISIPEPDQPKRLSEQRKVQPVYDTIQTVHHEGYLPMLAQGHCNIRVVQRTGSARFGFGVDVP